MSNGKITLFDKRTQLLVAFFGLLIAFPFLEIPLVGISVSFPLFVWICHRVKNRSHGRRLFWITGMLDKLMLLFILAAGISIILAPPADRGGLDLVIKDAKSFLYLAYWFGVYLFFRRWYHRIDVRRLSFFVLIGILLSTIVVLFGYKTYGGFYAIGPLKISQNAYALNAVACIGVGAVSLLIGYKGWPVLLYALGMIYPMLRSDSRAGIIIMVLQGVAITALAYFGNRRRMRQSFVFGLGALLLVFSLIGVSMDFDAVGDKIGAWVEPYSPDMAEALIDPQRVNEQDKSWLIRKTQVDKGIDLFGRHPLTGVGWGHFKYVRGDIDVIQYEYLTRSYDDYALARSSHNSYIQVLAETGLLGFIPLVLIQLFVIRQAFRSFMRSRSVTEVIPLAISLVGVAIYFWAISAITGAVWYFVIGLFAGAVANERRKNEAGVLLSHSR